MSNLGKLLKIILIICIVIAIPLVIVLPFILKGLIFSKLIVYPNSLVMLLIAIQFTKLFKSIEEDNPFTLKNTKILKNASIYSFVMSFLWFIDSIYLSFIKSCNQIDYYIVIIFFIILFFGVGTALYILSKLFGKATNYKEENDLTIW